MVENAELTGDVITEIEHWVSITVVEDPANEKYTLRLGNYGFINPQLALRFDLYTVCGAIVVFASLINIFVFSSTKEFRQKYILFNALAVADMINGVSFVTAGIGRRILMSEGVYFEEISATDCLYKTPWAILMIIAGQLPAFLNFFLTLERVVALNCASCCIWTNWGEEYARRSKWVLIEEKKSAFFSTNRAQTIPRDNGCTNSYTNARVGPNKLLLFLVFFLDKTHNTMSANRICAVMNSTGIVFGSIHYALIAITYLLCFIALIFIFNKTKEKKIPSKDELRRQKMLQTITGVSVVLVSIPNVVLILNEWQIPKINDLIVGIAYCLYALHSALSLPIYLYFRPDFTRRFLIFLCRKTEESKSEITLANSKTTRSANRQSTVAFVN